MLRQPLATLLDVRGETIRCERGGQRTPSANRMAHPLEVSELKEI